MDPRQEHILRLIIEDYIRTAEPVGSKWLSEKHKLDISPATVRNVMAELEQQGFIRQPHTSAGRIPTEKGYLYYLQQTADRKAEPRAEVQLAQAVQQAGSAEHALKNLAKALVDLSGETVIVAFDPQWSYYTGVSNLFLKPDFSEHEALRSLSALVDQFDDVVSHLYEAVTENPQVRIGSENPFGRDMSAILVKYTLPNRQSGLLGLLSPLRMDYRRNMNLMELAIDALTHTDE